MCTIVDLFRVASTAMLAEQQSCETFYSSIIAISSHMSDACLPYICIRPLRLRHAKSAAQRKSLVDGLSTRHHVSYIHHYELSCQCSNPSENAQPQALPGYERLQVATCHAPAAVLSMKFYNMDVSLEWLLTSAFALAVVKSCFSPHSKVSTD
jgi:hypothetical protein